jgi:superfamily I DNA/RNA helicase|tara:strand:+ start:17906 stop:19405 length:1500 start_codon:yes stop_codon:yes gene_type:complete
MIKKILGPPGTGKTRTLLDYVDEYVKRGISLNEIGYFAFTKKAANEAKQRMLERHPELEKKDLKYFQTLHSLAFHTLGLSEERVMQPEHYEQIGSDLNIRVNYYREGEEICYLDCDNEYFKLINKARVKGYSIEKEFNTNEWSRNIDFPVLNHIYQYYLDFKHGSNLVDYTDMLELLIDNAPSIPQFKAIFIDEAQDLAPIQWKVYDTLLDCSDDMYLAGDDDQAIFAWAGADVDRFITEPAKEIVLDQSERIPQRVQEISNVIMNRIQGLRKEKIYHPKFDKQTKKIIEGHTEPIYSLDNLNLQQGNWLILARTTYRVSEICKQLKQSNLYYNHYRFGKSFDTKLFRTILNWTSLAKGKSINRADCKDIFDYLNIEFNENLGSEVTIKDLNFKTGLPWYEVFTNADQSECFYIRNMLAMDEKLSQDARIQVSTIHAAKGGECENVVLVLDNTKKIRDSITTSLFKQDEEHRVWYVGVTRSAQNLYILKPKKERNGYNL